MRWAAAACSASILHGSGGIMGLDCHQVYIEKNENQSRERERGALTLVNWRESTRENDIDRRIHP
jgi:hypothetical protein